MSIAEWKEKLENIYVPDLKDVRLEKAGRIMFLSIKRKFSNALLNTVIIITFVFCCYLAKQVSTFEINHCQGK